MKLSTLLLPLVLLCAIPAIGQNGQNAPCNLKLSDLPQGPELMGFRLAMTMDQIKKRVPQVVFGRTDRFGASKTTINPDFSPAIDKSSFQGVRTVSLDFLDGRLTSLWIGYDPSFKWHSVDEFVKGISESLHLPGAWRPWKLRGQQLNCSDFDMTVNIVAEGPSFRIFDKVADNTFASRREELEEERAAAAEDAQKTEEIVADKVNKIYYAGECEQAKTIAEVNRIAFKSAEEAEKAGYKKAPNCN